MGNFFFSVTLGADTSVIVYTVMLRSIKLMTDWVIRDGNIRNRAATVELSEFCLKKMEVTLCYLKKRFSTLQFGFLRLILLTDSV